MSAGLCIRSGESRTRMGKRNIYPHVEMATQIIHIRICLFRQVASIGTQLLCALGVRIPPTYQNILIRHEISRQRQGCSKQARS